MMRSVAISILALSLSACGSLTGGNRMRAPKPPAKPRPVDLQDQKPPERTFEQFMTEGDRSRNAGRVSDAAWNYLRAMRRNPDDPKPAERIGLMHLAASNPEDAQVAFENVLRTTPEAAVSHVGLGYALLQQGEFERAEAELMRAKELRPDDGLPLAALGVLYDGLGRFEEARTYYQAALKRSPNDPNVLNNLGTSYLMEQEFELASEFLTRASELDPSNTVARNNLALALGQQGRYDEAWKALIAGQSEADALNNLGFLYYLGGDANNAIRCFERALGMPSEHRAKIIANLRKAEALLPVATAPIENSGADAAGPLLGPELPPAPALRQRDAQAAPEPAAPIEPAGPSSSDPQAAESRASESRSEDSRSEESRSSQRPASPPEAPTPAAPPVPSLRIPGDEAPLPASPEAREGSSRLPLSAVAH